MLQSNGMVQVPAELALKPRKRGKVVGNQGRSRIMAEKDEKKTSGDRGEETG